MTKSDLFKAAHKLAKEIRNFCSDYRTAFSCALKAIYGGYAMEQKSELTLEIEALVKEINEALEAHKAKYSQYNSKRLLTVANGAYIKSMMRKCREANDESARNAFNGIDWNSYNNEMELARRNVRFASNW